MPLGTKKISNRVFDLVKKVADRLGVNGLTKQVTLDFSARSIAHRAKSLREAGDAEAAEHVCRTALDQVGSDSKIRYELGRAIQEQGRWEEAETEFGAAIQEGEGAPTRYYNLGRVQQEQGNWQEAEHNLTIAIEMDPSNATWYYNLAKVLEAQGLIDRAIESLERATVLDSKRASWENKIATLYMQQEDWESAAAHLQRALDLEPRAAKWRHSMHVALRRQDQWERAEEELRQALSISPDNASWHYSLATLLRRRGDWEGAAAELREAIRLDGSKLRWHQALANVLRKQRDFRGAKDAVERARPLDSDLLVESISRGQDLVGATVDFVRRNSTASHRSRARGFCETLRVSKSASQAGELGLGVIAENNNCAELAQQHFSRVDQSLVHEYAPSEYWRSLFLVSPKNATQEAREAIDSFPIGMTPEGWLTVGQMLASHRATDLLELLILKVEPLLGEEKWTPLHSGFRWLGRWISPAPFSINGSSNGDGIPSVRFSLLDYRQPDYKNSSKNVGDYIQTLAFIGHLLRFQNLTFSGESATVNLMNELREEVGRNSCERLSGSRTAEVQIVQRDATGLSADGKKSWMFAFGWFMHSQFGLQYDFPFEKSIMPLFVSFHCNRLELLNEEGINYLRKWEPIGCRDWSTVDMLKGVGIKAFLSGCLTSTIENLYPNEMVDLARGGSPGTTEIKIDCSSSRVLDASNGEPSGTWFTHHRPDLSENIFADNLRRAYELLLNYVSSAGFVRTSRLHAHLPLRALGVENAFEPKSWIDLRFPGLVNIDDDSFGLMRDRLNHNMARIIETMLSGVSPEEVLSAWEDLWAPELKEADERFNRNVKLPRAGFDPKKATGDVILQPGAGSSELNSKVEAASESCIEIAVALDSNLFHQLCVVGSAIRQNTLNSVRLWVLHRGIEQHRRDAVAELFPEFVICWLACDEIDYGPIEGMIPHTTVSTMDRLLLPDLLSDLNRILYLDLDLLPLGDLSELFSLELRDRPLAARTTPRSGSTGGYRENVIPAFRRSRSASEAENLWRWASRERPHPFPSMNAGVLLLNLEQMRRDNFTESYLGLVGSYGLNDQELLNLYSGSDRVELEPKWNHLPLLETVASPEIIHWAGAMKPWGSYRVPRQSEWDGQVAELKNLCGERDIDFGLVDLA